MGREYDIDLSVNGLPYQLLPVRWRAPQRLAWLACLLISLKFTYEEFMDYRDTSLYRLAHTGQVCFIEGALNDVFDSGPRRIYISDGPYEDPCYLYLVDEDKPLFIDLVSEEGMSVIPDPDPVPLYTSVETYTLGVQFIVNVPVAVSLLSIYDRDRLEAIVNLYRLPGKGNYEVVYF